MNLNYNLNDLIITSENNLNNFITTSENKTTSKKRIDNAENFVVCDGEYIVSKTYESDKLTNTETKTVANIMPDIMDVNVVFRDEKARVVRVLFADGLTEKAVLSPSDNFSLEQGISICITKKLLSDITGGYGTPVYNKIIKHAIQVMNKNSEAILQQKREQEEAKERIQRKEAKRAARKAAKKTKEREEAITIQKEAFLRAMHELQGELEQTEVKK